jgi:hypothetical protein
MLNVMPGLVRPVAVRSTGLLCLDEALGGGFPSGSLATVCTERAGGGALRVVVGMLAGITRAGREGAVVDGPHTLYPPGLHGAGVVLEHLLAVWPPGEGEVARNGPGVRAAEDLLRHGGFPLVAMRGLYPDEPQARRLLLAAEAGRSVGVLVDVGARRPLQVPCATRLSVHRAPDGHLSVQVVRRRGGPAGKVITLEETHGLDRLHMSAPPGAEPAISARAVP